MKTDLLPRQLLLALAVIGLMIGCGGNKDTEEKPGQTGKGTEEKSGEGGDAKGSGNQSAAKKPEVKKVDLATSLSGKRIVLKMPSLKELEAQGVESPEPKVEPGEPKDAGGGTPQKMTVTISKIEEAGPLKKMDFGIPGEPDGLDPEGIDGGGGLRAGAKRGICEIKTPCIHCPYLGDRTVFQGSKANRHLRQDWCFDHYLG